LNTFLYIVHLTTGASSGGGGWEGALDHGLLSPTKCQICYRSLCLTYVNYLTKELMFYPAFVCLSGC